MLFKTALANNPALRKLIELHPKSFYQFSSIYIPQPKYEDIYLKTLAEAMASLPLWQKSLGVIT